MRVLIMKETPEEGTEEVNVIQGRTPLGVEMAQQIVDLPISELQTNGVEVSGHKKYIIHVL